ncbi:hypothetical protein L211DRAFT_21299 [Terfezia boudieri ATCC MYA-4762]|uniref:Uncharacterized protein n=1 Tax=Terfezia boudieri ATCC MYA-4762 TaxID=1051890 RepID=A0A3N4M381_9PEZI|nr:hypothetical protein L211DRAFT_21299 [Terfezia boudieri ATCC MYA-4762]
MLGFGERKPEILCHLYKNQTIYTYAGVSTFCGCGKDHWTAVHVPFEQMWGTALGAEHQHVKRYQLYGRRLCICM